MMQHDITSVFSTHKYMRITMSALMSLAVILSVETSNAAAVVSRSSGNSRPTVSRTNNANTRMPTLTTRTQSTTPTQPQTNTSPEPAPTPTPAPQPEPEPAPAPVIIENKSSQFDTTLSTTSTSSINDANADRLAEQVRHQRAALDVQSASNAVESNLTTGQSACDIGLRECMKQKCGNDYTKCAGDGDMAWGDKMDACRRNLPCTGHQYQLFSAEIKADRDMNAKLASYTKIIDCGNEYNDCIIKECGETYAKCLGKTAGDAAIEACSKIAKNCTQQDSGMAGRTMSVLGTLRQDAEKQVAADEKRLYEMRDKMASRCQSLGATFDQRSLVCVFTVNFFAGNSATPTASKKLYGGSTFDCTPNWFGIDVTTFKENAYRYTRSQTSATSGLMGAGLGMATGAITSGAINRAIDRQKAENAAKKAEKEHEENYGDKKSDKKEEEKADNKAEKADKADKKEDKSKEPTKEQKQKAEKTLQTKTHEATKVGGEDAIKKMEAKEKAQKDKVAPNVMEKGINFGNTK